MFVLTLEQREGRGPVAGGLTDTSASDAVQDVLRTLSHALPVMYRRFARRSEREVQGVVREASHCLVAAKTVLATGGWSVGIGVGDVDLPLDTSPATWHGQAVAASLSAVTRARSRTQRCCVLGESGAADDADAVLVLTTAISDRWSPEAVEAVGLVETGMSFSEAAMQLGVTRQAVGQRLAAALWGPHRDAMAATQRLLAAADRNTGGVDDTGGVDGRDGDS